MTGKTYHVNEVYRSVQGEGGRVGTDNLFLRFAGCNMQCRMEPGPKSPGGFDCDTEFASGRRMDLGELWFYLNRVNRLDNKPGFAEWVIVTGGEPLLQLDETLVEALHEWGYKIAIETNGSLAPPPGIDYVACSPKVAEHAVRCMVADEVRYVRGYGQAIPRPVCKAKRQFISPAFCGNSLDQETLTWCRQLVTDNPTWELSIQQHKLDNVR